MKVQTKPVFRHGFMAMTVVTFLCMIFALIYNQFGHGVHSMFMDYLFLIPLTAGTLIYGILCVIPGAKAPTRLSFNCYNSGVATLIVGSLLKGVFVIAGTASPYLVVYWIVGLGMLGLGMGMYLLEYREDVG